MSNLLAEKRVTTILLLSVCLAGNARAATTDEEALVDPTVPLRAIPLASVGDESGGEGLDSLFGMFASYELSSVMVRSDFRVAVINNEQVRVGDQIGSATVTSIEPDHVTLNVGGEIQRLELYADSIKTLVKGDE